MKVEQTSEKTTTQKVTLTGDDIIELLKEAYPKMFDFYDESSVEFHVPGGGDYSNMDLEVDAESPITITFITTIK